ncbi:ligase-associated DNA damage response endonuclease PdeM [Duganella dendranthematis]|jgi:DNA ligase-associated metallophosphoesterase|uniref:Ligase-associated DNA damage response endonuclease PdeM n=1 Tax=Duganella dendranthematis TaxID=2728021 RepID=A0ABX6M5G8_9BURK|nr:ligase-associated DNA damage response endonuclease PdeM [Duganella dendranthematis]QJD89221.1 ligase-associated DNA damage response endonuclease PdeM [Duganella dendranthematis]
MMLTLANEQLLLLPQKAAYWPREGMLIIADIHFGKAASFRALGVPVPAGTTSANLLGLDALLAQYDVRHVMFLGDFLHARAAHAPATLAAMLAWRQRHPDLRLTVVRGNHDAHAGDPPAELEIEMVDEPHVIGPFAFCHHPDVLVPSYVLAGHVHPVYRLRSGWESLLLPCFLVGPQRMVLPSFGAFTGGHPVMAQPDERMYVSSGEAVLSIP